MSDDDRIERAEEALAAALAIEPSAGFKAAVRRRVAESRVPRRAPLVWVAGAAAAAAVVAAAMIHRPSAVPVPAPVPPLVASRSATPAVERARAPAAGMAPRVRARRRSEPFVLVPAGEARRIQAYYEGALRTEASTEERLAGDLRIPPIDIEPLPESEAGAGSAPGNSRGL